MNIKQRVSIIALSLLAVGFFVSPALAYNSRVFYGTKGVPLSQSIVAGTGGVLCETVAGIDLDYPTTGTLQASNNFGTGGNVAVTSTSVTLSGTPTVAGTTSWTLSCIGDGTKAQGSITVIIADAGVLDGTAIGTMISTTTGTVKTVLHNGVPYALVIVGAVVALGFLIRFLRKHTK